MQSSEVQKSKSEILPLGGETNGKNVMAAVPNAVPKAGGGAKRGYLIVGGLSVALVVGIGGYAMLTSGEEDTDDAQVSADIVPVGTRVAGLVTKVNIKENDLIKKGAVIAEIDDAEYAAREKQAAAELKTAEAQAAAADAQEQVVEATSKGGL